MGGEGRYCEQTPNMPGTVLDAKDLGDFSNRMYSDTSNQDSESGEGTERAAHLNWELMGHPGVESSRKLNRFPNPHLSAMQEADSEARLQDLPGALSHCVHLGSNTTLCAISKYKE